MGRPPAFLLQKFHAAQYRHFQNKWLGAEQTGVTALQRSKKPLGTCLACNFCNCLQHTACENSACSSNGRAAALQGGACWQDAAITLCWGSESGLVFPFFPSTHPGEHWYKYIRLFLFAIDTAEQKLSVYQPVALSRRTNVSCVAYWTPQGCN